MMANYGWVRLVEVKKWKDRKDFNFPPFCLVRSEKWRDGKGKFI